MLLEDAYLCLGVSAIATAASSGRGECCHYGAAVLAAYWFVHDHDLSDDTVAEIRRNADRLIAQHSELFAGETCRSDRLPTGGMDGVVDDLSSSGTEVWAIGHDAIFTSLMLRSLRAQPSLATSEVVRSCHDLLAWCRERPIDADYEAFYGLDVRDITGDDLEARSTEELAVAAFQTVAGFDHVVRGFHQGEIGHALTHAQAIVDLDALGFPEVATRGQQALRRHLSVLHRLRDAQVPGEAIGPLPPLDPTRPDYWRQDLAWNDWAFGHSFKYPYAIYSLRPLISDPALIQAVDNQLPRLV